MPRQKKNFLQSDLVRAINASKVGGLTIMRTEIRPDGTIMLHHQSDDVGNADPYGNWKAGKDARAA